MSEPTIIQLRKEASKAIKWGDLSYLKESITLIEDHPDKGRHEITKLILKASKTYQRLNIIRYLVTTYQDSLNEKIIAKLFTNACLQQDDGVFRFLTQLLPVPEDCQVSCALLALSPTILSFAREALPELPCAFKSNCEPKHDALILKIINSLSDIELMLMTTGQAVTPDAREYMRKLKVALDFYPSELHDRKARSFVALNIKYIDISYETACNVLGREKGQRVLLRQDRTSPNVLNNKSDPENKLHYASISRS